MIPRLDGYETAQRINRLKEHKTRPAVPVTAGTKPKRQPQEFRSGTVVS